VLEIPRQPFLDKSGFGLASFFFLSFFPPYRHKILCSSAHLAHQHLPQGIQDLCNAQPTDPLLAVAEKLDVLQQCWQQHGSACPRKHTGIHLEPDQSPILKKKKKENFKNIGKEISCSY